MVISFHLLQGFDDFRKKSYLDFVLEQTASEYFLAECEKMKPGLGFNTNVSMWQWQSCFFSGEITGIPWIFFQFLKANLHPSGFVNRNIRKLKNSHRDPEIHST